MELRNLVGFTFALWITDLDIGRILEICKSDFQDFKVHTWESPILPSWLSLGSLCSRFIWVRLGVQLVLDQSWIVLPELHTLMAASCASKPWSRVETVEPISATIANIRYLLMVQCTPNSTKIDKKKKKQNKPTVVRCHVSRTAFMLSS